MGTDDADPDDDALKGLRSMWLSLPDEEPPARGLDALMAAARVKANEMAEAAQPSMWERFVAMMRRPQVLTLATIMILIGGAVFIGQHRDALEAKGPQVPQEHERASQDVSKVQAVAVQAPGGAEGSFAGSSAAQPTPPTVTAVKEAVKEDAKGGAPKSPEPEATAQPPRNNAATATKSVAKTKSPSKPRSKSYDEGELSSSPYDASDRAGTTNGAASGSTGGVKVGGAMAPKQEESPTIKQLHARARTAAAAKDCATVRSLAKQIAAKDAAYYRANIATDAALAACL